MSKQHSGNGVVADPQQPRPLRPHRRRGWIWYGLGIIVALIIALSIIGTIVGPPPRAQFPAAPRSSTPSPVGQQAPTPLRLTYRLVRTLPPHMPTGVLGTPNFAWLQATRDHKLHACNSDTKQSNVWDLRTGKLLTDQESCDPEVYPGTENDDTTAQDGHLRAVFTTSTTPAQDTLTIYQEPGDHQIQSFDAGGDIVDIGGRIVGGFSPDSALFATKALMGNQSTTDALKVWDTKTWRVAGLVDIQSGSQLLYAWTWGVDSHTLMVGRDDGNIKIYHLTY